MSRLTDLNQALRRQSSRTLWIPELATAEGARGQSPARNDAARDSHNTPATAVRLSPSLRVLLDVLVQPVMRAIRHRRTARALLQLDAHLLADIGIERDEIDEVVARVVKEKAKAAQSRFAPRVAPRFRPLAALRRGWQRQAAIAALQRLPDWTLSDIGIERGRIPEAVDALLARDEVTPVARPEPVVTPLPAVPARAAAPAHKAAA